jgi:proteasome lid subunit RPN8/RPN11
MSLSDSRIRLHPDPQAAPKTSAPPLEHALQWRSDWEDEDEAGLDLFVTREAYIRFSAHAASDLGREVGGGLAGRRFARPGGGREFIVIDGALPARFTRQGSTFLTFTQDTLVSMHDDLEARFPEDELVGWFHTHPGMGVFLSGYDVWLHEHFFPHAWQVALVIEPHEPAGGFFVREHGGRLDPHRYRGFFECREQGRLSVVHWRNLLPDSSVQLEGGEARLEVD